MFGQTPISLAGDQLCSKCLDDRAGIASILLTMKQLKKGKKLRCNIAVLISAQEEVTGLGAQTGAFAVQPEYAIAVDVTDTGDLPEMKTAMAVEMGGGPAVKVMDRSVICSPAVCAGRTACSTSAAAPPSAWAPTCTAA